MAYLQGDERSGAAARRAQGGGAGGAIGSGLGLSTPTGAVGSGAGLGKTRTPAPPKPRVTTTSTGQYTKPMNVPAATAGAIPDIEGFLGSDVSYQNQLRQFQQALADMSADVTRRKGGLQSNYATSSKALADQRTKDLSNIEADYGARGLLRSGLYGKAQGDYETEYNTRSSDLQRQQNEALSALDQQLNQYGSQENLQSQAAREAAIRRRAEQYGI